MLLFDRGRVQEKKNQLPRNLNSVLLRSACPNLGDMLYQKHGLDRWHMAPFCYGLSGAMMSFHNPSATWHTVPFGRNEQHATYEAFPSVSLSETQCHCPQAAHSRSLVHRNISFRILAISSAVSVFIFLHMANHSGSQSVNHRKVCLWPIAYHIYPLPVVSSCVPLECFLLHAHLERNQ